MGSISLRPGRSKDSDRHSSGYPGYRPAHRFRDQPSGQADLSPRQHRGGVQTSHFGLHGAGMVRADADRSCRISRYSIGSFTVPRPAPCCTILANRIYRERDKFFLKLSVNVATFSVNCRDRPNHRGHRASDQAYAPYAWSHAGAPSISRQLIGAGDFSPSAASNRYCQRGVLYAQAQRRGHILTKVRASVDLMDSMKPSLVVESRYQ
jgi:hypothetical protein